MPQVGVLHVIGGNDRGKRFDLTLGETRIGRGADQDIVLSDIAVSRRHVTIHQEGLRYRLKDLGSGNGTLVNGQRIDSHILNDGDHVEIGQTVMRFDHVESRAAQAIPPGFAPPPVYQPPEPARAMPPAPSAQLHPSAAPFGEPSPGMAVETPSDHIRNPSQPSAMPMRGEPFTGQRPGPLKGAMDTPLKRMMVFGGMGFLCIIGLIIIITRTVFAKPPVVASEAEETYRQGLRLFAAGDYEGAKVAFSETLKLVPDSPETRRYDHLCDAEVQARGALRAAERAIGSRRFVEAHKSLEKVESSSVLYDQATKLRRENAPRAAAEDVEEARRLAADDPDTARARLGHALELDPGNEDVRAMIARLKSGASIAQLAPKKEEPIADDPPPREPPPSKAEKPPKVAKRDKVEKDEFAPVKVTPKTKEPKEVKEAVAPAVTPVSGNAMAAYKAKDFAGADKMFRQEAMSQPAKQAQKSLETANQVRQLKQVVERAVSAELSKPDAAIKDYEEALALDARLGRGMHAGYFKGKIGKLQVSYAQQAFGAGKYDVAYQAANMATRYGAGDGGVHKQLESKAGELVQKGMGLQKSNIGQAKQFWRMVIRMVPTSSPTYARAYQLLNNAGAAHRDEDED